MVQKLKKNESGFSIIEVMIVLAIAGLIMVVVFLAVPALQRNSRNNALSTDANNILAAVGEYAGNNGGTLPSAVALVSGGQSATIGTTGGTVNQSTARLGGNITTLTLNGTAPSNSSPVGTANVRTGTSAVCNATGTGLGGTGGPRSYVILYVAEGANNSRAVRCQG